MVFGFACDKICIRALRSSEWIRRHQSSLQRLELFEPPNSRPSGGHFTRCPQWTGSGNSPVFSICRSYEETWFCRTSQLARRNVSGWDLRFPSAKLDSHNTSYAFHKQLHAYSKAVYCIASYSLLFRVFETLDSGLWLSGMQYYVCQYVKFKYDIRNLCTSTVGSFIFCMVN